MIWLARVALRLAARAGLRWLLVAAGARFVLRRLSRGVVERATSELEAAAHDRLPVPVARAVSSLPSGVRHAGASALVATRTARNAFEGGQRARRATRLRRRQLAAHWSSAREAVQRIQTETDASARRLRSRYLGAALGADIATDALVDGVGSPRSLAAELGPAEVDPHEVVAPPVSRGRRRAPSSTPPAPNRAGRSYRPPRRPWQ